MRIQVHDFAGHPFQAELSRNLAHRGHVVDHLYSTQYAGNHGALEVVAGDPATISFSGVVARRPADKYHPVRRALFELAYADAWIAHLEQHPVDVVICANVPLLALDRFVRWARRRKQAWVLWHQDIVSTAMTAEMERRLPAVVARVAARRFAGMERRAARDARRIVAIGDAFLDVYERWDVASDRVEVIPNWAPLDEIVPRSRNNAWALAAGVRADLPRIVYSGTLGRKHRPELLVDLSRMLRTNGSPVSTVVVSEGESADDFRRIGAAEPELSLTVMPFQPMSALPDVLGSADCLVALLEPDASRFSVPSKVLSYLAAGRPVLGFIPADNPAAIDIVAAGGFVATPDTAGVERASRWLAQIFREARTANALGRRARQYAEDRFAIDAIGARFERILADASGVAIPEAPRTGTIPTLQPV